MTTRKITTSATYGRRGATLYELVEFVLEARALGIPDHAVPTARVTLGGRISGLAIEHENVEDTTP